ncbi:hypothetical protein [Pedobacter nyackensis]|uniref:Uncharacterized protein n=1 Tax=Pedobacter nyackensis TaxID=475255 RepID=A0A1W2A8X9_9SPHI|nr:hypothetical protein [Pedobacter nyackensis]SMC57106.1 hypothetical protein SAMN04488101_101321 [Pedobacter nyackensis]
MNKISTHAEGNGTIKVSILKIEDEFIVINMISGIIPPPSYSIVHALFEINPKIYEKSFGPDTYVACRQFLKENSVDKSPYILEFRSVGGRHALRGLL